MLTDQCLLKLKHKADYLEILSDWRSGSTGLRWGPGPFTSKKFPSMSAVAGTRATW